MILNTSFVENAFFFYAQIPGQKPGEDKGTSDAAIIMDSAVEASRSIVKMFDEEWSILANGNSEIYKALVAVSLLVAAVLVAFWSIGWYQKIVNDGFFSTSIINEIIYPILIILLLSNNGALLANTSLLIRGFTIGVNDNILNMTRNGITLRAAVRAANANTAFIANVQAKIAECESKPEQTVDQSGQAIDTRQECKNRAIQQAKKDAEAYRKKKGLGFSLPNLKIWEIPGELANSAVQTALWVLLSGCEAAFQYIIQIAFLLNAYVAPIFLVLSLFPAGSRPIFTWLSAWLSLGLILVSYSIMVGLASSAVVNHSPTNPLFLPLLQGIFSPFLALGIGVGGGMSSFSGFTSIAKTVIKKI
ncbi:type IV secretion system protein [Mastigocoleus sp. MO_188.B34]|uniref:type IV secretion system protein n=1 Tax=Mastigocoleus sp. MO_188.B34 TaxID=3036635 RepID=UPI002623DC21|nr:type IV secretion system protein [Mastigocoleus sp. MO_188.B34]MDJ0696934.1 type IV secretion system protein [Mastigocoleus sp. MO_188.B34]